MYAIFRAKGKQFRAEPDATVRLPILEAEPGDRITFDEVLLASADGDVTVGTPAVEGASVAAEVVRHGKGEKIVVFKMKRRKNYRRKQGHRQGFTEVRIVDIAFPGKAPGKTKRAAAEEKKAAAAEREPAAPAEEKPGVAAPEAEAGGAPVESQSEVAGEPEAATDVDITDAARDLAEEHGLDLSTIEGTGKEGRILKSDVEKAIGEREDEAEAPEAEEGT